MVSFLIGTGWEVKVIDGAFFYGGINGGTANCHPDRFASHVLAYGSIVDRIGAVSLVALQLLFDLIGFVTTGSNLCYLHVIGFHADGWSHFQRVITGNIKFYGFVQSDYSTVFIIVSQGNKRCGTIRVNYHDSRVDDISFHSGCDIRSLDAQGIGTVF